jgi:formate-nitrite transporter family protein
VSDVDRSDRRLRGAGSCDFPDERTATAWLLPGADSSRVTIVIILTYLIGLGGFSHVIAGSTKQFYLIVVGAEAWRYYLSQFLVPTLLGNIIGGVSLVAFLGHAQVVSGKGQPERLK